VTARAGAALLLPALLCGCSSVVQYTGEIVDRHHGRTWFTRLPATVGGSVGFLVGIPVDVAVMPVSWIAYRSQPKETRDVLSVFMFPSFVLWRTCALVGAPFDGVEWLVWRSWQAPPALTPEEREAAERAWDEMGWSRYPVVPIHPPERADGPGR